MLKNQSDVNKEFSQKLALEKIESKFPGCLWLDIEQMTQHILHMRPKIVYTFSEKFPQIGIPVSDSVKWAQSQKVG